MDYRKEVCYSGNMKDIFILVTGAFLAIGSIYAVGFFFQVLKSILATA